MPTLTPMPFVFPQWFNSNGDPAYGHRLFTYEAGTSTKLATYTDVSGSVAHANPIVLDSAGRPPSPVFLLARSYKFVLAPPGADDPPTSTIWTADNQSAAPPFNVDLDVIGVAGETLAANEWVYNSVGEGGRTAGRWYKTDADSDTQSTTPRIIGIVITGGATAAEITVRRLGRVTGLSGLTAGTVYYLSGTAGAITSTAPANARRVGQADSTTSLVIAAEIVEPLRGFISLDLSAARELSAAATINAAGNGGLLASDTTPVYQRVNGATDQAVRLNWAAANVDEIQWSFPYPPDWDDAQDVTVHILAAMAGATNSPTMGIAYFEGVGDTNAGGSTAAISGTSVQERTITVTAANIGAHPNFASIALIPAAHGTDAIFLYAVWVEYVRKLRST